MANNIAKSARVRRESLGLPTPFREPSGNLERQIVDVFADVFGMDSVGADDDFYDLGGDSLLGETISMEILKATGHTFQVSWFYECGTAARISERLSSSAPEPQTSARPPIFTVHGRMGFTVPRPAFYAGLATDQKLVMFELPGIRGDGPSYDTIPEIAAAYVETLRQQYPEGPVLLAGFCAGGLIAIEMARQLARDGRPIHHMVLLDPGIPPTLIARHKREAEARGIKVDRIKKGGGKRAARKRRLARFATLLTIGRATDGSASEDFSDAKLRRWTARYIELQLRLERLGLQLRRKPVGKGGAAMKLRPRARLLAAYRTYWPEPYEGSVDVIASAARCQLFEGSQVWPSILPKVRVHVTGDTHTDVLRAEEASTARELQRLIDQSFEAIPANASRESKPPLGARY